MKNLYYAIGDIHGRYEEFKKLLQLISSDIQKQEKDVQTHVIQIGDIIDRGENSKACIEAIINLHSHLPTHVKPYTLQGNHEEILCKLWRNKPEELKEKEALYWYHPDIGGGLKTLESYGFKTFFTPACLPTENWIMEQIQKYIPIEHIEYLETLPVKLELGPYFFCHAGIAPDKSLEKQDAHTLRWIREPFLSHPNTFEKIVVHGHSPAPDGEIQHNRVNTDAAAAYGEKLKCFILPEHYMINDVRTLEVPITASSTWGNQKAFKEKINKAKKVIHGDT